VTIDKAGATRLIETAVGLNRGCSDIKVHSLAIDPFYSGTKTATITSKDLAGVLPNTVLYDRWTFDLHDKLDGRDEGEPPATALTLDTHFNGFTPLNSPTGDSDHRFE
jgi:hypothetical protein